MSRELIVHLLVESAVVRPNGLTIRLRPTGLMNLAAELAPEQPTGKARRLLAIDPYSIDTPRIRKDPRRLLLQTATVGR